MKKLFCLALSVLMLLGLAACGGSESAAGSEETTKAPVSGFQVGYARVDVTPKESVPMGGYGNSLERMSTGSFSYMPDAEAYKNIGYEGNQCRYVPGTAEQLVDEYLGMLKTLHSK